MRWIAFGILVYVVAALQTTLAPFLAVHSIRPDFVAIVAAHVALAARPSDALPACWVLGLVVDLTGIGSLERTTVGVHALVMAGLCWVMLKLREYTFRESLMAQLLFTFGTALACALVPRVYVAAGEAGISEVFAASIWTAIYTAIIAPYGHWAMRRLRGGLGIVGTQRVRVR